MAYSSNSKDSTKITTSSSTRNLGMMASSTIRAPVPNNTKLNTAVRQWLVKQPPQVPTFSTPNLRQRIRPAAATTTLPTNIITNPGSSILTNTTATIPNRIKQSSSPFLTRSPVPTKRVVELKKTVGGTNNVMDNNKPAVATATASSSKLTNNVSTATRTITRSLRKVLENQKHTSSSSSEGQNLNQNNSNNKKSPANFVAVDHNFIQAMNNLMPVVKKGNNVTKNGDTTATINKPTVVIVGGQGNIKSEMSAVGAKALQNQEQNKLLDVPIGSGYMSTRSKTKMGNLINGNNNANDKNVTSTTAPPPRSEKGIDYELIDITTPVGSPIVNNNNNLILQQNGQEETGNNNGTSDDMDTELDFMFNCECCNCQFCGSVLKEREGVMLISCLHVFCMDCIKSSIEQQGGIQAKCPANNGSLNGCTEFLMEKEIIAILTPQVYQLYVDQGMKNVKQNMNNIFECCTPNCIGWCEFEVGRLTFSCCICSKTNCLPCMAIHEGIDCNAYQAGRLNQAQEPQNNNQNGWEQIQRLIMLRNWEEGNIQDELQACDILITTMPFECPICLGETLVGRGIILQDCLHMFCRECAVEMIKHCDDPEVKCAYIDENYSCVNYLKPREIKALLPNDAYEKHIERSVKLAEGRMDSYHCKTPDCPGWCELEDGQAGANFFDCYVCNKRNCLKCNSVHDGTCEDYKNRLVQDENDKLSEEALKVRILLSTVMIDKFNFVFRKWWESGECMKCPKCGCVVQKLVGCDWLVCLRCKTELCWATKGPRWGPAGRGDISGGCKCDYRAGKPCVPTCQNCH